ncbi:hypothetical protein FOZ62_020398 [Perkinsus olseni]|uniref:N-acetyltransferase domain-containing protein n=2 Tax=Perkinsus olseni TaxID=32597 RepID=A0A7J6SUH5_PEROL|nr:hypothetical protein FOZ62_020398 [Perkinsus olseni]
MRLFIFGCLSSVALCRTARRGATMEQERPNEAEEGLTAADLEYRPWQRGDARYGRPFEPPDPDRLFVAADPKAASGYNVVGRVESELEFTDENNPKFAAAFPHAAIVHISYVWVHAAWRSKGVASTMLPKALEDIRSSLPDVVAVYLEVDPTDEAALRLYLRCNFTFFYHDGDDYDEEDATLLYQFRPRDVQ